MVAIDGGWQGGRYPNGTVYENPAMFPEGLAALVESIHDLGLLFGVYTDRGTSTCDAHVGSLNYEAQDAAFYARVGADYLKEDSCAASQSHSVAIQQFAKMQAALASTGRNIPLSLW
jgi:alpha-galactosidase